MGSQDKKKVIVVAIGVILLCLGGVMLLKKPGSSPDSAVTQPGSDSAQQPASGTAPAGTPSNGETSSGTAVVDSNDGERNPNVTREVVVDDAEVTDGEIGGHHGAKSAQTDSGTTPGALGANGKAANGKVVPGFVTMVNGKPVAGSAQTAGMGATPGSLGGAMQTGSTAAGAPQTATVGGGMGLIGGPLHPSLLEGAMNPAANGTAAATAQAEKPKAEVHLGCFTVSYVHKDLSSHKSGEACTHHRNLIKLPYEGVNARSVCVRVNGKAVKFQQVKGKPQDIVIGPIAGPTAKITARFCMNKTTCKEDCTIQKDEFMDAIGGTFDETGDTVKVAQWDPSEQNDADVSAEIDPEVKRELANQTDLGLFSGWLNESEVPACGTKSAHSGEESTPHS
jgi:enhancing lycopene biosynthesis protein 2